MHISHMIMLTCALGWLTLTGCASLPTGSEKVLYHVNLGNEQATDAIRNIQNHLEVDPNAKIVVVTHAKGVDFLMEGAEDSKGNPYSIPIEKLATMGVEFRVCQITLQRRNLDPKKFSPVAKFVPSGVKEVTRLQIQEGYAYLKP
jgi:intracellular sulfur oxidation DsrE/DsrF family protein